MDKPKKQMLTEVPKVEVVLKEEDKPVILQEELAEPDTKKEK